MILDNFSHLTISHGTLLCDITGIDILEHFVSCLIVILSHIINISDIIYYFPITVTILITILIIRATQTPQTSTDYGENFFPLQ